MFFYIFLSVLALVLTVFVVSDMQRVRKGDIYYLGHVSSKTKKRTLGDLLFLLVFLLLLAGIAITSGL